MTTLQTDRTLTIETVHNIRHLGGHPTASGGRTAGFDVVRAAGLAKLAPAGISALRDAGIRTIVDLRSDEELESMPTPDVAAYGINTIHAPVFQRSASPESLASEDFPGYAAVYRRSFVTGREAYRRLFEALAHRDGGVLFHCAAGKDRTGLAAMLLLSLAEVPDEVIVADYHASEESLAPMRAEWEPRMAERGIDRRRAAALLAAPEADMWDTLAHLRSTWGSAAAYLHDIGLTPADVKAVQARMAG